MSTNRTIYAHQNSPTSHCPDGKLGALLMALALGEPLTNIRFVTHGKELDELEPHAGAFFVDICPSTRLDEWAALEPVVLDHHPTALAAVSKLNGRFGLNERRESGAALALEYLRFHGVSGVPASATPIVEAIARRDTWDRSDEHLFACASAMSGAVMDLPMPMLRILLESRDGASALLAHGLGLRDKHLAETREAVAAGVTFPWRSKTVRLIQDTKFTSDGAELCDEDVLVGYKQLPDGRVAFSMRSRKGVNVGAIAKAAGGGGHDAAAGFTAKVAVKERPIVELWELCVAGAP